MAKVNRASGEAVPKLAPGDLPGDELDEANPYLKMMLVGFPGSGKTRLIRSFALDDRTTPLLLLDSSGGTVGIRSNPVLWEPIKDHVEIRTVRDAKQAVSYCAALINPQNHGRFKTIAIDDGTAMYERTKVAVAHAIHGKPDATLLEGYDYAVVYDEMLKLYRALNKVADPIEAGGAGMHVIFATWPEAEKHPETGKDMWVPKFNGKFGFASAGWFDIVAFLSPRIKTKREGGVKRKVFTNRLVTMSETYFVKDRTDVFGHRDLAMPTATAILDALEGGAVVEDTDLEPEDDTDINELASVTEATLTTENDNG